MSNRYQVADRTVTPNQDPDADRTDTGGPSGGREGLEPEGVSGRLSISYAAHLERPEGGLYVDKPRDAKI